MNNKFKNKENEWKILTNNITKDIIWKMNKQGLIRPGHSQAKVREDLMFNYFFTFFYLQKGEYYGEVIN